MCIQNLLYSLLKTAGLQVYGHNKLLLYFSRAKFGSCTCTEEMAKPFPTHPGIERRVTQIPGMTHVGITIGHHIYKWHMNDVECNGILSCDCSSDEMIR